MNDSTRFSVAAAANRQAHIRYQGGHFYKDHGAWYVRYRWRVRQEDGSNLVRRTAKHLGRCKDFANAVEVKQCRTSFMLALNRDSLNASSRTTVAAFVEGVYFPWAKKSLRACTSDSYHGIWKRYLRDRVGGFRLRELRTVDVNRMLEAIAKEKALAKGTFKRIKSVLSVVFIYAKNVGAFDGANPVDGALIPKNTKEPGETHAYDLSQDVRILAVLPLLGKVLVASAAFAGLRSGELRGLEWTDYTSGKITVNRSLWRSVVNPPKTEASCDSVPVVSQLAQILDEYRKSMGNPETGVIFHSGNGLPINLDAFTRRVIRPALEAIGVPWYGWHAFRRGLASNLYALGAQDKVVQRILRHARPHVTRDRYIKAFDSTLLDAMERLQRQMEELGFAGQGHQQLELNFDGCGGKKLLASDWPAEDFDNCAKLLIANTGEVAERLKAAVC